MRVIDAAPSDKMMLMHVPMGMVFTHMSHSYIRGSLIRPEGKDLYQVTNLSTGCVTNWTGGEYVLTHDTAAVLLRAKEFHS